MKQFYHGDEREIRNLLLYRKVISVSDDTLTLDNGTKLEIVPNNGCGGCNSGWYYVTELNNYDNIITNVEFECDDYTKDNEYPTSYKIFVFTENRKTKLFQVDGDDGNGWYGTGYSIIVRSKDE